MFTISVRISLLVVTRSFSLTCIYLSHSLILSLSPSLTLSLSLTHSLLLTHSLSLSLRALAVGGGLPHLHYMDLSGLPNITERGLSDLTSTCPSLQPELLFYCDNLVEGPYAQCASGCQNVGLSRLACCRMNY